MRHDRIPSAWRLECPTTASKEWCTDGFKHRVTAGGRLDGNELFMSRLIWRDKQLMKARVELATAAETNSRHPVTPHQLLQTQLERTSLVLIRPVGYYRNHIIALLVT